MLWSCFSNEKISFWSFSGRWPSTGPVANAVWSGRLSQLVELTTRSQRYAKPVVGSLIKHLKQFSYLALQILWGPGVGGILELEESSRCQIPRDCHPVCQTCPMLSIWFHLIIKPLLYWFQLTEAADLDAHHSTDWPSAAVDDISMKKYHRERDALIDLCSCRLSAPLPEEW